MYKIAFHLAKGKNYQHWQIKDANNECIYINPNEYDLILFDCKLKNQVSSSIKIFNGGDKLRCAWIEFKDYQIVEKNNYTSDINIGFNPRKSPNWTINNEGNFDNSVYSEIKTNGNKLYL